MRSRRPTPRPQRTHVLRGPAPTRIKFSYTGTITSASSLPRIVGGHRQSSGRAFRGPGGPITSGNSAGMEGSAIFNLGTIAALLTTAPSAGIRQRAMLSWDRAASRDPFLTHWRKWRRPSQHSSTDIAYSISHDTTCRFAKTSSANNGDGVDPLLSSVRLVKNGDPKIALQSQPGNRCDPSQTVRISPLLQTMTLSRFAGAYPTCSKRGLSPPGRVMLGTQDRGADGTRAPWHRSRNSSRYGHVGPGHSGQVWLATF